MANILALATAVLDCHLAVAELPRRGQDVLAAGPRLSPGGSVTVMRAARGFGVEVRFAGTVGTGPFGELVRRELHRLGVTTLAAGVGDVDTGLVLVLVEPDGERSFVTTTGAEGRLDTVDLHAIRPRTDEIVYLSGYTLVHPRNQAPVLAWLASLDPGAVVCLDPGPLFAGLELGVRVPVLARADLVTCSASEFRALDLHRGVPGSDRGPAVLERLGGQGCRLWHARTMRAEVASPVVAQRDATGAGDVHTGVLLSLLQPGTEAPLGETALVAAIKQANAAAALSVTRPGTEATPTRAEVQAWRPLST